VKNVNNLLNPPFPRSKAFSTLVMKSLEGLQRYHLIMTAWESGLFDFTVTPKTYQEIAKELGYQEIMTRMFCDALTELGLLIKKDCTYINSPLASNYLSRSSSLCMTNNLQNMRKNVKHWNQLATLLKNGPIKRNRKDLFKDDWIAGIAEWAEAGSVFDVMKVITKYLKVCRWRRTRTLRHRLYCH
jgi:hypothetical protein